VENRSVSAGTASLTPLMPSTDVYWDATFFFCNRKDYSREASLADIAAGIEEGKLSEHIAMLMDSERVNSSKFIQEMEGTVSGSVQCNSVAACIAADPAPTPLRNTMMLFYCDEKVDSGEATLTEIVDV